MFEDKTQNNIIADLRDRVDSDINTAEGSLIHHAFAGAAAEFEKVYLGLEMVDQNGYAVTADREHLILKAKERGIIPLSATKAVWKAVFNNEIPLKARFSAGELTYICTEQIELNTYRLMCEKAGSMGNTKQGDLTPIDFIKDFESGDLIELLVPARDEEETESFRRRYLEIVSTAQAFGGNRAQYKAIMKEISGVGACKIYRVTQNMKRIKIFFLNSLYQTPNDMLVSDVQQIVDPLGKQGEGEGKAVIYHVVDISACESMEVDISAKIEIDKRYDWDALRPKIENQIGIYYMELAKSWENEEFLTVRILKINAAIASVEGVIDVQETELNGVKGNLILKPNVVPVKGEILRKELL